MKHLIAGVAILTFAVCNDAIGCGGGGISSSGFRGGGGKVAFVPGVSSMNRGIAMQQAQFNMAKQASAARAAAYHAQMMPIRIAKAQQVRAEKIANRNARTEIRLAKLEAKRTAQREFLAKARTWTDRSGNYEVRAVLVDANGWGVKLRKQSGDTVNVPMERLSSPDQTFVASVIATDADNGVMLVGL